MLDPEDFNSDYQEGTAKTDFTGRELLIASLQEKCYHRELAEIIELGGKDNFDLERTFIDKMVSRLSLCEQKLGETGTFKKECLFTPEDAPDPVRSKIKSCVANSFEIHGDYDSNNRALEADLKWSQEHHLDYHPSITINDFTYRGDIDFADIREAICAAYQERPSHCNLEEIWKLEKSQRPINEGTVRAA